MQNYTFENINDKEFEAIVNDLISFRENKNVERFKSGKDKGIDGRFYQLPNEQVIIQSKHWLKSGVSALISKLSKDELAKIKKLAPKRYILATSLPLSQANKLAIKNALSPYIKSEADILGQEDLNDLLGKYPNVEKRHYKLWLSSTTVLQAMLNAALIGRSESKRDDILETTQLYVVTENHERALAKLNELHSVVITGEGGIGKTTLADQLAHHLVAKGFELCVIEDDLSEAEAHLTKGKKQVFYYDDFLGRNYLMAIEGRKDSRVLDFMKRIERDSTKRFILTSRSTVLKQGKLHSDLLEIKKIDKKEYEITIASLPEIDRAKILYNHIWNSKLPESHIEQLYVDRRYANISSHKNFNPRLISFITDSDRVADVPSAKYWGYIEDKLDNPKDIWAGVFDNQIDELTRIAICLLVFNGTAMPENQLKSAFRSRTMEDGLTTASNAASKFESVLKAGVGSVMQRTLHSINQSTVISLFNPSLADFVLGRYFNDSDSLSVFFGSLHTEQSLINLLSLRQSLNLDQKTYASVLKLLGRKKLHPQFFQNHPNYCIRLVHALLDDEFYLAGFKTNLDWESLTPFLPMFKDSNLIDHTCSIFTKAIRARPELFCEAAQKYILQAAPEAVSHEDFLALDNLRQAAFGSDSTKSSKLFDQL